MDNNSTLYAVTEADHYTLAGLILNTPGDIEYRMNRRWVSLDRLGDIGIEGLPLTRVTNESAIERFDNGSATNIDQLIEMDI